MKTMLWGHAADLVQLQDGRVLCTYGYPMLPNPGIRGCVSEDGRHWESENIFVIQSVPSAASQCIQIGSPASVQFRDGTILTAYHAHGLTPKLVSTAPVQTHIEGALYRLGDQTDMVSVGA